jgi:hypothetical protein
MAHASRRCGFLSVKCALLNLITVMLIDVDDAQGVGYTFSTPRNGAAMHALEPGIAELFDGAEADEIERLWRKAWWHCSGRGGPTVLAISAFEIALWDFKAKRAASSLTSSRRFRCKSALLCRRCRARSPATNSATGPLRVVDSHSVISLARGSEARVRRPGQRRSGRMRPTTA